MNDFIINCACFVAGFGTSFLILSKNYNYYKTKYHAEQAANMFLETVIKKLSDDYVVAVEKMKLITKIINNIKDTSKYN